MKAPGGQRTRLNLAAVMLSALVVSLYAPVFNAPFVFDDPNTILINSRIQQLAPIRRFLASNRPLTELSFALNFAWQGFDVRGYHAANLALHALAGLLVFALAYRTLQFPALTERYGNGRTAIALAAATLFVVHPLQTETAAYVSSRSGALAAVFYLLAVNLYALAITTGRRVTRYAAGAALPLCAGAALASKESAVTLPVALLLYDWCFVSGGKRRDIRHRTPLLILALAPALVAALVFLTHAPPAWTAGFSFARFGPLEYLLTQFGVVVHYLRLAAVPVGLTLDYDWPLAGSAWSANVLLPLTLLTALAGFALVRARSRPLSGFAILWTFLILAPTSSILPIADVAAERRMYLPLAGLMILAASRLWDSARWANARFSVRQATAYALLVAVPIIAFSSLTRARAKLWADPMALYEDCVMKTPGNPRARLNLAATYLSAGRAEEGRTQLVEAARLYERGQSIHAFPRVGAYIEYDLAALEYKLGNYAGAQARARRALGLLGADRQLRPAAFSLLGRIAARSGQWKQAARFYEVALRYEKAMPSLFVDLAVAYIRIGSVDRARETLREALRQDRQNRKAATLLRRLPSDGQ